MENQNQGVAPQKSRKIYLDLIKSLQSVKKANQLIERIQSDHRSYWDELDEIVTSLVECDNSISCLIGRNISDLVEEGEEVTL